MKKNYLSFVTITLSLLLFFTINIQAIGKGPPALGGKGGKIKEENYKREKEVFEAMTKMLKASASEREELNNTQQMPLSPNLWTMLANAAIRYLVTHPPIQTPPNTPNTPNTNNNNNSGNTNITGDATDAEKKMMELHNEHRKNCSSANHNPLTVDPKLVIAARKHSKWMNTNRQLSHDEKEGTPDFVGVTPWERCRKEGTMCNSENVAMASPDPNVTFQGWLNSPDHHANIDGATSHIGCGNVGLFWTCAFR